MPDNIKFEVIKKIAQTRFKVQNFKNLSKIDSISPPSVFIGSKLQYPLVNVGILSPLEKDENAWVYDDAKFWSKNNFEIQDVIRLREGLLNSKFQTKVQDLKLSNKLINIAQEIAIASKPVDIEIELKNRLNLDKKVDRVLTPHGMKAQLKEAKITSNVKVHKMVDRVMNDEIKATEGIQTLYKKNFNEYSLSKILSVGVLGLKKNKKLVPTRWSITATDDIISKKLISDIKNYKWVEDYELFFGEFLGNAYLILLFPDIWSFELFELYLPGSSWNLSSEIKASTDYENYHGRKDYASNTQGGYYATRLPILEYLSKIQRQASVLVIRLEKPTYWASLGVWVVRESVHKAFENRSMKFKDKEELLLSTKKISEIKHQFNPEEIFKRSILLNNIQAQKRLGDWI
ncbi:MAG: hypothetical protein QT05_C0018G0003 [archaeon GW2011_AR13]|nr:MAG: hypothetical protein QT05_C0018G0003 [archaeon GW2011_AR13]HIG94614.1 hypothetical protein [Nanoarchaeota archaeon]HIH63353.1 hypothetical protein [Nanoarchaeota archaeon]HIJ09977.1 hypothetical protein [Nanoarchaeota archaeon]